jgi:leader peptidase (prepilin peptidase)/N-methyltransferase
MILLFFFILGAIVGSFLNVCIYRVPKRESLIYPASHCTHCGRPIKFYDNIPLISYILLGGKCRYCKEHISIRYPVVEGLSGLLCTALFIKHGLTLPFVLYFCFAALLLIITFIDIDYQLIPDIISLPGIFIGLGSSFLMPHLSWLESFFGILIGGGFLFFVAIGYKWLTGRDGMGGGDVKLLAMMGAWLGWKAIPFVLLSSSLIGAVVGGGSLLINKKGLRHTIPFGPFLSLGSIIYIFFGTELTNWYITYSIG